MYDTINAVFEMGGIAMCIGHIKTIKRDKSVAGVYVPAVVFFSLWGYWNLLYYSHLEQWVSLTAGGVLAIANSYWAYLLYKFKGVNNDEIITTGKKAY